MHAVPSDTGASPSTAEEGSDDRDRAATLLNITNLSVAIGGSALLSEVSMSVRSGELVGLVGESGSGKTLTGMSVLGLLPPHAQVSGSVRFEGEDLLAVPQSRLRAIRGDRISMIFQEPRASLHPSRPVGKQIIDVIRAHRPVPTETARKRAEDMLDLVGLSNPRRVMSSYTHQLSGGMCQRVMIAMALVSEPQLLIADEPTTALDVTIQAQVMTLLRRLADELGLAVLLITHNLGVVTSLCSRIVTMYCGQVVNDEATEHLVTTPSHPYPAALLRAADIDLSAPHGWSGIAGAPANPANPPSGCRFHPRCEYAEARCLSSVPQLGGTATGGRTRCLRSEELILEGVSSS